MLPEIQPSFSIAKPSNVVGPLTQTTGMRFEEVLQATVEQGVQNIRDGEAGAIKGVMGEIPIHEAVAHVMQAERTLQLGLSVRDKCMGAFLELSRMQI